MKLVSLLVFRSNGANPILLASAYDLKDVGFWYRNSAKEVASFVSRTIIARMEPGVVVSVSHKEHLCHVHTYSNGLCLAVLSDAEYPGRVAFTLIDEAYALFQNTVPDSEWKQITQDKDIAINGLSELLTKYQKPEEVDKLLKIQKDLEVTKQILLKSVDSLLERGEKLESIAAKSEHLSLQSKAFMTQAEKINSCCTIL